MYVIDPYHYFVVCEAAPDVMQRIQRSNPDAALPTDREANSKVATGRGQTGAIIIPGTSATDGLPADGGARGKGGAILTLLAGRVLWSGPGKHVEGALIVPPCKLGEIVLFSPRTVSYEFNLHGRSIKIVPYSEITGRIREVAADDDEWTRLPKPASEILKELGL